MANPDHVEILKQGVDVWNTWREVTTNSEVDLSNVDFSKMDLCKVNFSHADLRYANLRRANLCMANLNYANLEGTNFYRADLSRATLHGSSLKGNDLRWVILSNADLSAADLTGCSIYAISAWNVNLKDTKQTNLTITDEERHSITVDNLEVAQFIYLLLHNEKIRHVIDTITSKVVLVLGRFTPERKQVLDALRDELRSHNYSPVVFDFEEQSCESLIDTVRTLASMAHLVLIDLTNLEDRAHEIATSIVPRCVVPMQPFLLGDHHYNQALFRDLQHKYRWVLSPHRYKDVAGLLSSFQENIIQPAEDKITELKQRQPLKVFCGYAPEDRDMLDTLKKHLRSLERSGQIEMWDDRNIDPGNTREEEVTSQLSDAGIILLLISPDFIASNNCYTIQEKAMELYERGKAKVIPILLRSCAWKSTPLVQLQVLPRDERSIDKHNLDDIFFEVSEEISSIIKEMM